MKGNIADMIFMVAMLLVFAIVTVLSYKIWSDMSPQLNVTLSQANGGTLAAGSALAMVQTSTTLLSFDYLFAFLAFGSLIAIVISSFWLDSHPIFFVVSLLAFIFTFIPLAVLGNVYSNFETDPAIQAAASNFPFMESFFMNLPTIGLVFGVLIIIILYSKFRGKPNASGYSA